MQETDHGVHDGEPVRYVYWHPLRGIRIGEAANPGPNSDFDDFVDEPDDLHMLLCDSDSDNDWQAEVHNSQPVHDGEHIHLDQWSESDSDDQRQPGNNVSSSRTTADEAFTGNIDAASVVPPWDAKLSEQQILEWETAERTTGIKRSVTSWLKTKRKWLAKKSASPNIKIPNGCLFHAAPAFAGSQPGYYFGTGQKGLGYIVDLGRPELRKEAISVFFDALIEDTVPNNNMNDKAKTGGVWT